MPPLKYKVLWGEGYEQKDLSKTEALKIAAQLLNDYNKVTIQSYYK